jgi:hypothetical protein
VARIVVITHEYDSFVERRFPFGPRRSMYMLFDILREMERRGHSVRIASGLQKKPAGDLAIVHLDCTIAPEPYLAWARQFGKAINAAVADISKRKVSGALLSGNDDWQGPVIVKSDLNCMGIPEAAHNARAAQRGNPPPHPPMPICLDYTIFETLAEAPATLRDDPRFVVEKFLPEPDPDGFALRTWVFMGERERCTRHVSRQRVVKAADIVKREPAPVPDEMRAERQRLGFDYGKFDFVVHDGRAILLDANKTPGSAPAIRQLLAEGMRNLADGLERMLAS